MLPVSTRVRLPALIGFVVCCFVPVCFAEPVSGQEFRIESKVFLGDATDPASHNVTVFTPKLVCDFLMTAGEPTEIVMFDRHDKVMVVLDPERNLQTEIMDVQLIKLIDDLRNETAENQRASFLVQDNYSEDIDLANGQLTLTSPAIEYRVKGSQPDNVSLLPMYLEFLDQFTRLNATDPAKLPPFPRMRLNRSIRQLGWMPTEVQITTQPDTLFKESFSAMSTHELTNGLSNRDRELMQLAKNNWMEFKKVGLPEYHRIGKRHGQAVKTVSEKEAVQIAEKQND